MEYDKPQFPEILEVISRLAGNLVGAAVAARNKIELCAKELTTAEKTLSVNSTTKPNAAAGDTCPKIQAPCQPDKPQLELKSELKALQAEKETLVLNLNQARNQANEAIAGQEALKSRVATLQSDLNTAKKQLAQKTSNAQKTQSELEFQLKALANENKILISDLERTRQEAQEAKAQQHALRTKMTKLESHFAAMHRDLEKAAAKEQDTNSHVLPDIGTGPAAENIGLPEAVQEKAAEEAEPSSEGICDKDLQAEVHIEQPQPSVTIEPSGPGDVTAEELQAAVFDKPPDRVIFTKALSDLAGPDAAARIDAVRAIATVRHKLSVQVLAANAEQESSPSVRQECIKALANLEMQESLPAIKNALADPAASVRLAAVWGLYRLAGIQSVSAIAEMFLDDNEEVRRRAVNCIAWLGKTEKTLDAARKPQIWKVISGLIGRLQDPAESVRKAALDALETITGKKISTPLPIDENTQKNLISQWHKWWKDKLLG